MQSIDLKTNDPNLTDADKEAIIAAARDATKDDGSEAIVDVIAEKYGSKGVKAAEVLMNVASASSGALVALHLSKAPNSLGEAVSSAFDLVFHDLLATTVALLVDGQHDTDKPDGMKAALADGVALADQLSKLIGIAVDNVAKANIAGVEAIAKARASSAGDAAAALTAGGFRL